MNVNSKKYFKNFFYRTKFNVKLFRSNHYQSIVNSRGSRNIIYEDSIIRFLKAKNKVALDSDNLSNSRKLINILDALIYNEKIYFDEKLIKHELEKSFLIFQSITEYQYFDNINLNNISNFFEDFDLSKIIDYKYFTLNVGAGQNWKEWDIRKFIELGNYICDNTQLKVVYLGLEQDYEAITNSQIKLHAKSLNLCGKTNLPTYFRYIKNSEFSIGNDSSAIHLSIFFDIRTLCIKSEFANDSWYPYPDIINKKKWRLIKNKKLKYISVNSTINKIEDWIKLYE